MYTTSTCLLKLHLKRYTCFPFYRQKYICVGEIKEFSFITAAPDILFNSHLDQTLILGH